MSIRVDYDALAYISAYAASAASTARSGSPNAASYGSQWVNIPMGADIGTLAMKLLGTSSQAEEFISEWARDTNKALEFLDGAVAKTADEFRKTDASAVTIFQGVITQDDVSGVRSVPSGVAARNLVQPVADKSLDDAFKAMGLIGGVLSPTYWLGNAVGFFIGLISEAGCGNPLDKFGETLAGD